MQYLLSLFVVKVFLVTSFKKDCHYEIAGKSIVS